MGKVVRLAFCITFGVVFGGCDQVPQIQPPEEYVGMWEHGVLLKGSSGTYNFIHITRDGFVSSGRATRGGNTSFCSYMGYSPLSKMNDARVEESVLWLFSNTFELGGAPKRINGRWVLTVDGTQLVKVSSLKERRRYRFRCDESSNLAEG